ncbi:D-aminoacyl-tRNA deacylase [Uliginosibacterium sp. H1]|uniref:D-aminoacyl-tRNA deacylase n=1 Tax=Uliginosibacterium sp. H1 TaxID=3114757 RepID=UPI002E195B41|nr:D-aminoacyl-tRNA deacylase [Uliginosibacterium sp. H1]
MIALIQRVRHASVSVAGEEIGRIGPGLLAFVGVQREDDEARGKRLLERVLTYRVFGDDAGRMNRSLRDTGGGLLLVSQFTLAADTRSGTRASFTPAAEPARAQALFDQFVTQARAAHADVACGRFGADMQVSLLNDGPVTFWLEA